MDLRLTQAERVHQSTYVVLVIANVEALLDRHSQACSGPAIVGETESTRSFGMKKNDLRFLSFCETAWTTCSAPLFQPVHAFMIEGATPARCSGPANAELTRDS